MPVVARIVNLSLKSGPMPSKLKEAVLKPLLKKTNLDQTEFKNYRPVSNLSLLSKAWIVKGLDWKCFLIADWLFRASRWRLLFLS